MNYSKHRTCDACRSAVAVVYCRADAAGLCAVCDASIHAVNPISSRHHRVPIDSSYEDGDASNYEAIFGDDVDEYLDLEFDSCTEQEQKQTECGLLQHVKHEYVVPVQTVPCLNHAASHTVPDNNQNSYIQPSTGPVRFSAVDRESRVLRYREKKKNRKFEKTIRYASRKAYAEARPRIKGRFAKRTTNLDLEVDQMFSNYIAPEDGYGVVPYF